MGQRSVERPRSVSTALSGELGIESVDVVDVGKGGGAVSSLAFGAVPRDRAAITS
tara:strand:+ start:1145 stop:1309 length:165 start_codon:yes stop_codon:yes gene_type:complete